MKVFASVGVMGSLSVGAAACQYPGVGPVPRAQPTILLMETARKAAASSENERLLPQMPG